jgi:hypothetical protein
MSICRMKVGTGLAWNVSLLTILCAVNFAISTAISSPWYYYIVWSITNKTFEGSYIVSIPISLRERIAKGPVLSCAIARSTFTVAILPVILSVLKFFFSYLFSTILIMFINFSAKVRDWLSRMYLIWESSCFWCCCSWRKEEVEDDWDEFVCIQAVVLLMHSIDYYDCNTASDIILGICPALPT